MLLPFVKIKKKTFFFKPTFTYRYGHFLFFSFYFNFIIYSQLVKEKGENERRLL